MTPGWPLPPRVAVAVALVAVAAAPAAVGSGSGSAGTTALQADPPRFLDVPSREHRGDVVRIPVALPNGSSATVSIGGNDTDFAAHLTLADGDGDGRVTLLWNAHLAGSTPNESFRTASADDAATVESTRAPSGVPPVGTYDLGVAAANATPADRTTLRLERAAPPELAVLRAGSEHFENLTAPRDVAALRRAGALGRAPTATLGDDPVSRLLLGELVVLRVRAPGLAGALAAAAGPNATTRFGDLLGRDIEFLVLEHPAAVAPEEVLSDFRFGDFAGRRVVADPANDTYYVVLDPTAPVAVDEPRGAFVDEHDLEGYRVHLGVPPDAGLPAGARENATTTFWFAERSVTIDDVGPPLRVAAAGNVTVTGSALLAPASAVVVRVSAGDDRTVERRVRVAPDGDFEVTFDLSGLAAGERYEVTVRTTGGLVDRWSDRVQPWALVRSPDGERYVQHVDVVRVDVATTDGGFVTVWREPLGRTLLGHSTYLPPGNHTDVRVPVDAPLDGNVTLIAVAYRDDGDREFERADAPYAAGDPSDAATLVDVDGTPTVPSTATTAATGNPIPGPGGPFAVVAVVAGAVLVARRRS